VRHLRARPRTGGRPVTYDRDRMIRRINNTIPVECFAHTTAQSVGLHHAAMTWLLDEIDRLRAIEDAARAFVQYGNEAVVADHQRLVDALEAGA